MKDTLTVTFEHLKWTPLGATYDVAQIYREPRDWMTVIKFAGVKIFWELGSQVPTDYPALQQFKIYLYTTTQYYFDKKSSFDLAETN